MAGSGVNFTFFMHYLCGALAGATSKECKIGEARRVLKYDSLALLQYVIECTGENFLSCRTKL